MGNITRPLKRSNGLSSLGIVKPVLSKNSNLYPFPKALVNASQDSGEYPKLNFSIVSVKILFL
jgi:hypothetical protein